MMQAYTLRPEKMRSKLGILHSRFASTQGPIKESLAHPHSDDKNRVLVFHNGFIANYEDLSKQLIKTHGIQTESDSQLIAKLIGVEMDNGSSVKEALKNVVERKLMGTWKLAVLGVEQPDSLYLVKNSGDLILGQDKNSVVVSTTDLIFT